MTNTVEEKKQSANRIAKSRRGEWKDTVDVEGTTEWNSSASTDNLERMGRAEATTNEEGGDFKMAGASLLDLKATPIVACWSNHRKGVGFAFHTLNRNNPDTHSLDFSLYTHMYIRNSTQRHN
ncbi:hypothetical protein K0M31_005043 [Melipona bicolor]|uniref:Uncharacterized protein n=1 Tax=Melipona bicolor TaxID=60889 RepID=A0AA40FWZ4_9HYME|nr:hypothetical protein K0M31_005043 [Melipona bicolor]